MSLPLVAIRGEDDARLLAENCQLQRECRQVTVEWMSAMHNWLPDINFEGMYGPCTRCVAFEMEL